MVRLVRDGIIDGAACQPFWRHTPQGSLAVRPTSSRLLGAGHGSMRISKGSSTAPFDDGNVLICCPASLRRACSYQNAWARALAA